MSEMSAQTKPSPGGSDRAPMPDLEAPRDLPVGGQAVLEGVMMRGVSTWAVAIRTPTAEELAGGEIDPTKGSHGEIQITSEPLVSVVKRHKVLRLPVIRGVVALGESLKIGFRALAFSANAQLEEDEHGEKEEIGGWMWGLTIAFSMALAVGLFFVIPVSATSLIKDWLGSAWLFWLVEGILRTAIFIGYIVAISRLPDLRRVFEYHGAEHKTISCYEAGLDLTPENAQLPADEQGEKQEIGGGTWAGTVVFAMVFAIGLFFLLPAGLTNIFKDDIPNSFVFLVIEKLIRITIFLAYIWLISRMRDLQRVFEYHGAEHKTISCYEAGLDLTPENAQRFSRLHPRCGTSFLLIVMIVAIFVFAPLGKLDLQWLLLSRVVGIPLVAGLAFEVIKLFGRNRTKTWARVLMWPGLQLQRLTTREPDLSQLAVAIAALEAVLAVENPAEATDEDKIGMEVVA